MIVRSANDYRRVLLIELEAQLMLTIGATPLAVIRGPKKIEPFHILRTVCYCTTVVLPVIRAAPI